MLFIIEIIPPGPVMIIERKDYVSICNNNNNTLHASSIYTRCT